MIGQETSVNLKTSLVRLLPAEIRKGINNTITSFSTHTNKEPIKNIPSIPEMERRLILDALELTSGSIPDAAKKLGLSAATLYRKNKKNDKTRTPYQ